jgi:hypothetical protein
LRANTSDHIEDLGQRLWFSFFFAGTLDRRRIHSSRRTAMVTTRDAGNSF